MVTDSACPQLLEGSFGVSDPYRPMYSAVERARTDGSAYISSEQAFDRHQFEFHPLYTPVRTAVSQT